MSNPMLTLPTPDSERLFDSYYESSLPDQSFTKNHASLNRSLSVTSSSSSDYSTDSTDSDYSSKDTDSPPRLNQRPASGSDGAADRRRIAVVQLDTLVEHPASVANQSETIRSRRGLEESFNNLVLVPAADLKLPFATAPSSAPSTHIPTEYTDPDPVASKSHHRSASEAVASKPTSLRNVGIVGTSRPLAPLLLEPLAENQSSALRPPIFIRPQTRSPSPNMLAMTPSPDEPPGSRRSRDLSAGSAHQHKSTDASSYISASDTALPSTASKPSNPSPDKEFLHYQPGMHCLLIVISFC